ncbi:MAG: hypothetical protein HQ559_15220 [Lentisphaerae bacterium]|nr:hypothetical protein [Lentisphaerota bacterium]
MMDPDRVSGKLVEAICDHLSTAQQTFGRPDPEKSPWASDGRVIPRHLHSPPFAALALYRAGRQLERDDYIAAADRYVVFLLAAIRDPTGGRMDHYSRWFANEVGMTGDDGEPTQELLYLMSRSWMCGISLDALCRGFMSAHPADTSFHAKAAALYDWLQEFRTDRGPYFKTGYPPSNVSRAVPDGAFSDDLGLVGRGLVSYYEVTKRDDVLEDLTGLSGYYVRAHVEDSDNSDDGCFSEEMGSWVGCPWAVEIAGEHIDGTARADRMCWGWSNREAVDFLTRLHGHLVEESLKTQIRGRVVSGMKWALDSCQHENGAIGMMGRDDGFTGMTGAAVCNFLDCEAAGFLNSDERGAYGKKCAKAMEWIRSWEPDDIVEKGGHKAINGGVTLHPPENMAWMLAWTVDALLRWQTRG